MIRIVRMAIFVLICAGALTLFVAGWGGLINRVVGYKESLSLVVRISWECAVLLITVIAILIIGVGYRHYDFQKIIEWLRMVQ